MDEATSSNHDLTVRPRRRRPLVKNESISCRSLNRQGSIDASGEETQEVCSFDIWALRLHYSKLYPIFSRENKIRHI